MTAEEATRALYLDFEGFADDRPFLIGGRVDGRPFQYVTDRAFASAGQQKDLPLRSFESAVHELVERAYDEGRRLVGFSQHEALVIRDRCGIDVSPIYGDGRMIAKRWWNRTQASPRPAEWSLAEMERALGLPRPAHLAHGTMTRRARHVRDQLERRGSYARLTGTAKSKWTNLLRYNELDVRNLERLTLRVTLSASPAHPAPGAAARRDRS